MKKLIAMLALAVLAFSANAQMVDDWECTTSLITTNSASWSQVIRGELLGVHVNGAATKTNVVLITSADDQTLFSADVSADAFYNILGASYGTTGSALTFVGGGATNDTANTWYTRIPVASKVTMRVAGAADTTGTNAVTLRLIWKK